MLTSLSGGFRREGFSHDLLMKMKITDVRTPPAPLQQPNPHSLLLFVFDQ